MDPNANLEEQLELSQSIIDARDAGEPVDEIDVDRLAELVQALDRWINSRGFLPKRWRMDDHSE